MVVIAEGVEGELFSGKISISYLKIIGEDSYHTQYLSPEVAEGFYCIEAAHTGADKVFNNNYALSCCEQAFYLVLTTVLFRLRAYIYERQPQRVGY